MKQRSFATMKIILIITGLFLMMFQTALCMDITNVLLPEIESIKGWTRGEVNGVFAFNAYLGLAMPFLMGALIMKVGVKKPLQVCILLAALGCVGIAFADTLVLFGLSLFLTQTAASVFLMGAMTLTNNWFVHTRGRVLGIITIGAPASTALFTPLGTWLISTFGYSNAFLIIGVAVVVICFTLVLMLTNTPEEMGLFPDNDPNIAVVDKKMPQPKFTIIQILKMKETWLIGFGYGFMMLMITGIMSQFISRLADVGIPIPTALLVLSLAAVAAMPISYIWGWLDDKIGTPKASALFLLTFAITSLALIYANGDRMWLVVVAGIGIASATGGGPNLQNSIGSWVYGRKEFVSTGRIVGTIHGAFRGSGFAIMGAVVALTGSYTGVYWFFIPLSIVASLLLFFVKRSYDPNNEAFKPLNKS